MSVLLLRLAGPMQSWGTQSRFLHRDTGMEPSRSGVIGLLCAALGRSREASLDDLSPACLRMGVRVDREGRMARDYHTAGGEHRVGAFLGTDARGRPRPYGVAKANSNPVDTVVSDRFYLADADFLVGLEGAESLLHQLGTALQNPTWPLFLGRKSFVPAEPVWVGIVAGTLEEMLRTYPWQARREGECPNQRLRIVLEAPFGQGEVRQDVPLSFAQRHFTIRHVRVDFWDAPPVAEEAPSCS